MAITPKNLRLPYTSEAFPSGSIPNTTQELSVTWDDILWAALTIGRPSIHYVFQHGAPSDHEAVFRISLLRMALEQYGPKASRLRRTGAFKGLDPTEKGAVSYFLGMVFCKIFASKLLSTPWLLHLDIYRHMFPISVLGRSRPDLFGQHSVTGDWHIFETKGRASKPSKNEIAKAKIQAERLISIGGVSCKLNIAAFTYFSSDAVNFYWIDPPLSERPLEIPDVGNSWSYYYGPLRSLLHVEPGSDASEERELSIELPQFDLKIRVHRILSRFFLLQMWEQAQRQMRESRETLAADGFQPDGIKIECGPSWTQRKSNPR